MRARLFCATRSLPAAKDSRLRLAVPLPQTGLLGRRHRRRTSRGKKALFVPLEAAISEMMRRREHGGSSWRCLPADLAELYRELFPKAPESCITD